MDDSAIVGQKRGRGEESSCFQTPLNQEAAMPHGHDACPAHMGIKEEKLLPTDHKLHHASVVICRFFRNIFRLKRDLRSISKRFIECLPSLTWLQNSSLGDLLGRVSEPFVVSGVNPFFQRSLRLFRWGGSGCDQVDGVVDVKIFTSAYAIAYHPESVFHSSGNDLDLLLSSYAKTMLECMHWSAVAVSSRPTWRAVREHEGKDLHRLVVQYLKAFKQWRSNEDIYRTERARKLIERVVKARDSLSSVLGSAANVDEEVVPLLQSIRARLEDSIHAIESKCGSGCSSSLSAVFGPGPPPIDWSSFAELYERRWHDRHGIENIQHEVLLDNSYQLSKKFSPCLQSCSLMADLSWRSVGDDLSSVPPRHARFVSILTALQKEFTLFSGGACKAEIDSAFPMKSIARDLAQNGLDNIKCFAILCIIADATRVVREKIGLPKGNLAEEWYNILSDPSSDSKGSWIIVYKGLRYLCEQSRLCHIEAANSRLHMLSPVIRVHGVSYERISFQKRLADGSVCTAMTRRWISENLSTLSVRPMLGLTLQEVASGSRTALETFMNICLVDAATCWPLWKHADEFPETLLLDRSCMKDMCIHFRTSIMSSVIIDAISDGIGSAFAPHAARMSACRLLVKNPPNGAALEASILLVMAEMRKLIPNEEIISRIEKNIYSGVSCQSVQYISARSRGILRWFQEVQGVYNRPEIDGAAIITHRLSDPWIKRLKTMIFFNMQVHEDIYSEIVANVTA